MSYNLSNADNQQGSPFDFRKDPSETTRRAPPGVLKAYLLGAVHDGTFNRLHKTFRFTQANKRWIALLKQMFHVLGYNAWMYREGQQRSVYALETTAKFLQLAFNPLMFMTVEERVAYVRGYFDAEGGIPHASGDRFYIQLCQKNKLEMQRVKHILVSLGIACGKIHNPSHAVDPDYWRFFVATRSHRNFVHIIGSWHPRKRTLLRKRMMI